MSASPLVRRVLCATDRSERAARAVGWAAEMANRFGAELLLVQVVVPQAGAGTRAGAAEATRVHHDEEALRAEAARLAGPRGRARVVIAEKPARALVEVAEEEEADALVVGNAGMAGRKEFLLGNVPNWVSHNARCTVVIVNTAEEEPRGLGRLFRRER